MRQIKNLKNNKGLASPILSNGGFTLIEMMVATTIFLSVVVVGIGSLIVMMGVAKDARALRYSMDNINFAMESMTRSIRMGTNYVCVGGGGDITMNNNPTQTADCANGTFIAFVPQRTNGDERVGYKLAGNTIQRCVGTVCSSIVSSDVEIDELRFVVDGSSPSDSEQASVYITIKGTVRGNKSKPVSFAIQTMASQRNF